MLQAREVLQLEDGERLMAVVRRHASSVVPGLLGGAFLIALPFFFLFPLVRLGFIGAVIISLSLGAGLYIALKTLLIWDANALLISDRRVVSVRQGGLWNRAVTELPLMGIGVTVERKGIADQIFRTGRLSLTGRGVAVPTSFEYVASPERIAGLLAKLRDGQNAGFRLKEL